MSIWRDRVEGSKLFREGLSPPQRIIALVKDNLSKALYVFAHFGSRAGDVLNSNYFLGVGRLRTWSANDLQEGVYEARRKGFVEEAVGGWRLTEAGFQEIGSVTTP